MNAWLGVARDFGQAPTLDVDVDLAVQAGQHAGDQLAHFTGTVVAHQRQQLEMPSDHLGVAERMNGVAAQSHAVTEHAIDERVGHDLESHPLGSISHQAPGQDELITGSHRKVFKLDPIAAGQGAQHRHHHLACHVQLGLAGEPAVDLEIVSGWRHVAQGSPATHHGHE